MLRNPAYDFIISCLIGFIVPNLSQSIYFYGAVTVLEILELIFEVIYLLLVLIDSLVEVSDISSTIIDLNYDLTMTILICSLQLIGLHMKLIYPMMGEL